MYEEFFFFKFILSSQIKSLVGFISKSCTFKLVANYYINEKFHFNHFELRPEMIIKEWMDSFAISSENFEI